MGPGALSEKVAIVTGSASGIGAATAKILSGYGANIVLNYSKSASDAQQVMQELRDSGKGALLVQADVSLDAECRKLATAAVEAWGRIDILINNAGTTKFVSHGDLEGLSSEDFAAIYAVNVIGPYQMIRACRSALKQRGDGSVVNVSSIAAMTGLGSSIAYAASKGALNTMTLSLARALAPEIRVNAICPGYVATPWFTRRFGEESAGRLAANVADTNPLKAVASAEDIANTIAFLAGPDSGQITGETLLVDSGTHLNIAAGLAR
ncbi:MAG TPA: glucose 1-dehydrogenase [Rhizomicrobium sp.]|nr:glucose 1-dehydrogenase [Rhizomicrobium sp.]